MMCTDQRCTRFAVRAAQVAYVIGLALGFGLARLLH